VYVGRVPHIHTFFAESLAQVEQLQLFIKDDLGGQVNHGLLYFWDTLADYYTIIHPDIGYAGSPQCPMGME
jgi:hypothetical protein